MKEGRTAKVQLMVEPSLVRLIDDWRFANRINSRAHAMRRLLNSGIDAENEKGPAGSAIPPSHGPRNPQQENTNGQALE